MPYVYLNKNGVQKYRNAVQNNISKKDSLIDFFKTISVSINRQIELSILLPRSFISIHISTRSYNHSTRSLFNYLKVNSLSN